MNNAALGKPVVVSIAVKLIFNVFDLVNYQRCHIFIYTAHITKGHIPLPVIARFKKSPDSISTSTATPCFSTCCICGYGANVHHRTRRHDRAAVNWFVCWGTRTFYCIVVLFHGDLNYLLQQFMNDVTVIVVEWLPPNKTPDLSLCNTCVHNSFMYFY